MEYVIEVVILPTGEVTTSPVVAAGDTVVWLFRNVQGQVLEVELKPGSPNPFVGPVPLPPAAGQPRLIRSQIASSVTGGQQIDYDIKINGHRLQWVGGAGGGCLKIKPPP